MSNWEGPAQASQEEEMGTCQTDQYLTPQGTQSPWCSAHTKSQHNPCWLRECFPSDSFHRRNIFIVEIFSLLKYFHPRNSRNIFGHLLFQEKADTEWKFARSKLWISYFEEGGIFPGVSFIFLKFSRRCFP